MMSWLEQFKQHPIAKLADASFDIFTYHGEDGIVGYLLQQLKNVPPVFVDIGAGNCITGNCTLLAVHFNWKGAFIDKESKQLSIGKRFYRKTNSSLKYINEEITPGNINQVITDAVVPGEIGLLSIDIDGNDYWIWKAITIIQPRIVVIEAKVEFGYQNVIVPYGANNHRSKDIKYNGGSVEAFRKLGIAKGYKLVGANQQGYNLFFVKQDENIPALATSEILNDSATIKSFYPESFFRGHKFVTEFN